MRKRDRELAEFAECVVSRWHYYVGQKNGMPVQQALLDELRAFGVDMKQPTIQRMQEEVALRCGKTGAAI